MFIPPNPNDRPLRNRQFALLQLVVLTTLVCFWSAGYRIADHPDTSQAVSEFLRTILTISGAAMVLYGVMLAIRYFLPHQPPQ
jgi:hypothetical protein